MLKARRHCAELGRITKSLCPAAIAPRLRHIGEIARSHVLNTRMRRYMQLLHLLSPGINLVPHHLAARSMPCIRRPGSSPRYCCPTAAKSRKTIMLPPLCPANQRVTDGARTRDLRSHNPMLCLLSYGHHARKTFYQESPVRYARVSSVGMISSKRFIVNSSQPAFSGGIDQGSQG